MTSEGLWGPVSITDPQTHASEAMAVLTSHSFAAGKTADIQVESAYQKQSTVFQNKKRVLLGETGEEKLPHNYGNIGLGFKTPKEAIEGTYNDKKCPFTDYLHCIRKYNRFEKRHKNVSVHLSPCFRDVQIGDTVTVGECPPLSKAVCFNVLQFPLKYFYKNAVKINITYFLTPMYIQNLEPSIFKFLLLISITDIHENHRKSLNVNTAELVSLRPFVLKGNSFKEVPRTMSSILYVKSLNKAFSKIMDQSAVSYQKILCFVHVGQLFGWRESGSLGACHDLSRAQTFTLPPPMPRFMLRQKKARFSSCQPRVYGKDITCRIVEKSPQIHLEELSSLEFRMPNCLAYPGVAFL
eukprot:bmy_16156T0